MQCWWTIGRLLSNIQTHQETNFKFNNGKTEFLFNFVLTSINLIQERWCGALEAYEPTSLHCDSLGPIHRLPGPWEGSWPGYTWSINSKRDRAHKLFKIESSVRLLKLNVGSFLNYMTKIVDIWALFDMAVSRCKRLEKLVS